MMNFIGSLNAAHTLINECQGIVCGCFVIMELVDLKGRDKLKGPVHSLMSF
jgi:adenine/guanine phosphoribosyltransferase-like PRPP-binding protein